MRKLIQIAEALNPRHAGAKYFWFCKDKHASPKVWMLIPEMRGDDYPEGYVNEDCLGGFEWETAYARGGSIAYGEADTFEEAQRAAEASLSLPECPLV